MCIPFSPRFSQEYLQIFRRVKQNVKTHKPTQILQFNTLLYLYIYIFTIYLIFLCILNCRCQQTSALNTSAHILTKIERKNYISETYNSLMYQQVASDKRIHYGSTPSQSIPMPQRLTPTWTFFHHRCCLFQNFTSEIIQNVFSLVKLFYTKPNCESPRFVLSVVSSFILLSSILLCGHTSLSILLLIQDTWAVSSLELL